MGWRELHVHVSQPHDLGEVQHGCMRRKTALSLLYHPGDVLQKLESDYHSSISSLFCRFVFEISCQGEFQGSGASVMCEVHSIRRLPGTMQTFLTCPWRSASCSLTGAPEDGLALMPQQSENCWCAGPGPWDSAAACMRQFRNIKLGKLPLNGVKTVSSGSLPVFYQFPTAGQMSLLGQGVCRWQV